MSSALEIMDKAYKVRNIIQYNLPPMAKVWAPCFGYGSVRFRVKYKTEPIFYAEITYEQITKMSVNQAGYFVMIRLTTQMLERIENNE